MSHSTAAVTSRADQSRSVSPGPDRQFIIVANVIDAKAQRLLRQSTDLAKENTTPLDGDAAEEKANSHIRWMVGETAVVMAIPGVVNWMVWGGVLAKGVVRIGRAFGRNLSFREGHKLLVQLIMMAGYAFASVIIGGKVLVSLMQFTGIGYAAGWALDVATACAEAGAIGMAAKAYFRGASKAEIKNVLRTQYKNYKEHLKTENIETDRAIATMVPFDVGKLHAIVSSAIGEEVVTRVLRSHPEISQRVDAYMSEDHLKRPGDLSVEHLGRMDKKKKLAQEVWNTIGLEVDLADLVEVVESPTVDVRTIMSLDQLREKGPDVALIEPSEAEPLDFPPAHPQPHVLYIGHPLKKTTYYPAACFHILVFEDKMLEALRFLESLGATRLEHEHVLGWSSELGAHLGLPFSGMDVGAKGEATGKSGTTSKCSLTYKNSLVLTFREEDFVWFGHEPIWQQIAKDRLGERRLEKCRIEVVSEEDFGVNLELAAGITKLGAGIELGGKFQEHRRTIWRVSAEFGPVEVKL